MKFESTSRRECLQTLAVAAGCAGLTTRNEAYSMSPTNEAWYMPEEGEPHLRTWMAFGANKAIWGARLLSQAQKDLALIARTIAEFEPVSMLVRKQDHSLAQQLVGPAVELIECPLDDLWMRDTGPVFVVNKNGAKAAVGFNFNGWGEKQDFGRDAAVASFVSQRAKAAGIRTSLVLEGGGIEVDGLGTAIITESCVLNTNRNPGVSKVQCETELKRLLGLQKVIWLPGIKGKDITDGHTDFYARFARPGVVVAGLDADPQSFDHAVTKRHLEILRAATDALGKPLEVVVLQGPSKPREHFAGADFAAGYINFYVCNGAVIAPEFGDAQSDQAARQTLEKVFPARKVVQINIDAIAAGGGGIHCTTQQEPKV